MKHLKVAGGRNLQGTCFRKLDNRNEKVCRVLWQWLVPSVLGQRLILKLPKVLKIFFQILWEQIKGLQGCHIILLWRKCVAKWSLKFSLSESSHILHNQNPKESVFSLIQQHFKEAAHIPLSLELYALYSLFVSPKFFTKILASIKKVSFPQFSSFHSRGLTCEKCMLNVLASKDICCPRWEGSRTRWMG